MSDHLHLLQTRWHNLTAPLLADAATRDTAFHDVAAAYGSPGRHYHTLVHINDLLQQLDAVELQDRSTVELAVWFHDVVYDAGRSDNELQSAALARAFAAKTVLAPGHQQRIAELIEHTADHTGLKPVSDGDRDAFLDADLSILGAPADDYWEYARNIRLEYQTVPDELYRIGRSKVLARMLQSPVLFRTNGMQARYEAPARYNLGEEIKAWRRGSSI